MMKKSDVRAAVAFIIQGYLYNNKTDDVDAVIAEIIKEIEGWIGRPLLSSLYEYLRPGDIKMLLASLREWDDPPAKLIAELESLDDL